MVWVQQGLLEQGYLRDHLKFPLGELLHQLVKCFAVKSKKSVNQLLTSHLKLVLCLTCSKTSWRTRQGIDSKAHLVFPEAHLRFPVVPQLWLHDLRSYSSMGLIYHSVSGVSWWSPQRCRLEQESPAKVFEKPHVLKETLKEVNGKMQHCETSAWIVLSYTTVWNHLPVIYSSSRRKIYGYFFF